MFSWLRKKHTADPIEQHFDRRHKENMGAVRELLRQRREYEEVVWRTLKIMFDIDADIVPPDRVEMVSEEIATLKEMGVVAPLAAVLIREKDWTEDRGPDWTYIREVAREGGTPLFELISISTPMVAATQMEIVRKACLVLRARGVSPKDGAKLISEALDKSFGHRRA